MHIKNVRAETKSKMKRGGNTFFFFIFVLLISIGVKSINAQTLKFPEDDGIHEDADFEAWSVFSHLTTNDGKQFGVVVFFFTGEVIGIKASGIYVVVADKEKKVYKDFSKIQIPLFSSTTHTTGRLLENYSDNILERSPEESVYKINVAIDDFSLSLAYSPLKDPIDIGRLAVGGGGLNRTYAIPRGDATAQLIYEGEEYSLNGIGIFQHQWGDKPEQSALSDIFALHLEDSTDVLIYHSDNFPQINTLIISDRNGQNSVIRNFTASSDTVYTSQPDNDKFKLKWTFESVKNRFLIRILPGFDGQEIEMLGLSYWLSRCNVQIDRKGDPPVAGVGYVYIGKDTPKKE